MARRKRVYGKRRRINYGRIALLLSLLIVLILLVSMIFRKNSYIDKIEEALNSDISLMTGTMSTVSKIDASVYENDGIKYTNQHEGIKRIEAFDGSLSEDLDKTKDLKKLLENLVEAEELEEAGKTVKLDDLPAKDDGYYWVEADISSEDKILFFDIEREYNFDLFYDIENKTIYVKEKYHDEFSTKYNKTKFQAYKATDEFISTIEGIPGTDLEIPDN